MIAVPGQYLGKPVEGSLGKLGDKREGQPSGQRETHRRKNRAEGFTDVFFHGPCRSGEQGRKEQGGQQRCGGMLFQ